MRFNDLLASGSIPWEGAWETSGIRFRHCNQDAGGFPCAFQALRPISVHTYPCQPGEGGGTFEIVSKYVSSPYPSIYCLSSPVGERLWRTAKYEEV